MEHGKQDLQTNCQGLEKKVQNMEAELGCKEEELQRMEVELEKEKEELKKVAAHWNERWLDVAMALQSTQVQLEETKKQQQHTEAVSTVHRFNFTQGSRKLRLCRVTSVQKLFPHHQNIFNQNSLFHSSEALLFTVQKSPNVCSQLREEASGMASMVEMLETQLKDSQ